MAQKKPPKVKRLKLRELMESRRDSEGKPLSANALAKAIGVSHNTIIAHVEEAGGQPTLWLVKALMDYFDLRNESDLVEWESQTDSSPELVAIYSPV